MEFKIDRTVVGAAASPDLVNLLEGALERVLDHKVIAAAITPAQPAEAVPNPEQDNLEPVSEPSVKSAGKNAAGKGKPATAAAKGKQAPTPAPVAPPPEPGPQEEPPPPPVADEYSEKIDLIKSQVGLSCRLLHSLACVHLFDNTLVLQCGKRIADSIQLEQYLKEQHATADQDKAADFDARDQEFSRFWRYAGLPHVAPPLVLDKSRLQAAGLLDHQEILDTIQTKFRKNVLNPPQLKEFSDSSAAPHYLAQTAANLNRAHARADMITNCKKSIAEGSAFKWHTFSSDKLRAELKASRDREILNRKRMNGATCHRHVQHMCCIHLSDTQLAPQLLFLQLNKQIALP